MAAAMKVHLQRVHFGNAAVGSSLSFSVAPVKGATVTAVLDCNSKVVASWEWVELKDGQRIEEALIPKGTYNLTLTCIFTGSQPATVDMSFGMNSAKKSRSMTGQRPDIGKAIAVVFIK